MTELLPGSLVICGDLLGFVGTMTDKLVTLVTLEGTKTVSRKACVLMSTPQEIAQKTCSQLKKVVKSNVI